MNQQTMDVLFSSTKEDWATPDDLYEKYNSIYHFDIDLAASQENTKHPVFFSKEQDSLKQDWHKYGKCGWLNPPYGRRMLLWIKKCYEESLNGFTAVVLLPARTDVKWFHQFIYKKKNVEVEFLRGRLQFKEAKFKAPFPSMVVIFRPI